MSFAACGFLGIYQLGAVHALLTHGPRLLTCLRACAGASAGALVAAVLLTAPDKLEVKLTTAAERIKTTTVWTMTATIKAPAMMTTMKKNQKTTAKILTKIKKRIATITVIKKQ